MTTSTGTVADLIHFGQRVLSEAGIPNHSQEVLWILEEALGQSLLTLQLERDRFLTSDEWEWGQAQLSRRATREPLQYILGTQEFYGLDFQVSPFVLIPRPETALLVETALQQCEKISTPEVLDMGTGSGCIAVSLAHRLPHATIYASDLSPQAITVAKRNARGHGVEQRIEFLEGNLFAALQARVEPESLPIIVSNPPYIASRDWEGLQPEVRQYEPSMALDGGDDGLSIIRCLVVEAPAWLEPHGWLNVEVGLGQAKHVMAMAQDCSLYSTVRIVPDEAGIQRVVCLQKA